MIPAPTFDKIFLRIDPGRIAFLRFILEGYDGLAIISTIDQRPGLVVVRYPAENIRDIMTLLTSIASGLNKNDR